MPSPDATPAGGARGHIPGTGRPPRDPRAGAPSRSSMRLLPFRILRPDGAAWDGAAADVEKDSLHLLPLRHLPLRTQGLARARLVKTPELTSMVELFSDSATGDGLIAIDALGSAFQTDRHLLERDISLLLRVGRAGSFDIYSLRAELRALGIDVDDHAHLVLSSAKQAELTDYMRAFTRPLIRHVYGDGDGDGVQSMADLTRLLCSPRRMDALANLQGIARRLAIDLMEIPSFLARYGDIFLSIAYFRSCRDGAQPLLYDFMEWLEHLRATPGIQNTPAIQRLIRQTEDNVLSIIAELDSCLTSFDRATDRLWGELSGASFQAMHQTIEKHHTRIGTLCCALSVKLGCWERTFRPPGGSKSTGATGQRLDWLRRHMLPGLSDVTHITR